LVLVDAAGYPLAGTPPLAFRLGRVPLVSGLMAHLDPRWLVARTLKLSYGDPARVTPQLIDRYDELALRAGNRAAFGARTAVPFEDHTAELARLRLPVMILWGGRDHLITVEYAQRFRAAIAGAELHVYDELGHVPMEEDGVRTAADVEAFLARQPR
jgi:pimeloyl-ACP methyl ester carboxylesterase